MRRLVILFFSVFLISFAGSLPPGTLNTGITSLVVSRGLAAVMFFGLGAILVELLIVWLALRSIGFIRNWFNLAGCGVILVLAVASFRSGDPFSSIPNPFFAGLVLSALNPLHFPFWLGWSMLLRSKRLLDAGTADRMVFVVAAGVGTAAGFIVYGAAGSTFDHYFRDRRLLSLLVGSSLLAAGLLQLGRIIRKVRTSSGQAEE